MKQIEFISRELHNMGYTFTQNAVKTDEWTILCGSFVSDNTYPILEGRVMREILDMFEIERIDFKERMLYLRKYHNR